jgi:hypothetical protein
MGRVGVPEGRGATVCGCRACRGAHPPGLCESVGARSKCVLARMAPGLLLPAAKCPSSTNGAVWGASPDLSAERQKVG